MRPAETITILGAGWLGWPLAGTLAGRGYRVRATVTTPEKAQALQDEARRSRLDGLEMVPFCLQPDSPPAAVAAALADATTLVVALSPGRDPAAYHAHLGALVAALPTTAVRRVLFLSATSVYPDQPGAPEVTEVDADPTHYLVQAEQLFLPAAASLAAPAKHLTSESTPERTQTAPPLASRLGWERGPGGVASVVRLAGLMGPKRHPGRFFGPGRVVPQPEALVNMLHQTDAVGALAALIEQGAWGHVLTLCADHHPTRRTFYTAAAAELGQSAPAFAEDEPVVGKKVGSAAFRRQIRYTFRYDDPLAALRYCS